MTDAVKYTFDTEFDRDGQIVRSRPPRPKTKFTREDVDAAQAEGFAAGEASAQAQAAQAAAQATMEALEIIKAGLAEILASLQSEVDTVRAEGARLALEAVRQLTRCLVDRHGEEHITALIEDGLKGLRDTPKVTIALSPDLAPSLGSKIGDTATTIGFEGQVDIVEDAALARADCRLTWGRGGASSDLEGAIAAIETLIRDHLEAEGNTQLSLFDR